MFDILFCIILGACPIACLIALVIFLFYKKLFAVKLLSVFLAVFIILFGAFFIGKFKIELKNNLKDYLTIPKSNIKRDYEGEISVDDLQSVYICMRDTLSEYLPDYDDPKTKIRDFSFFCHPKNDYFSIGISPTKSHYISTYTMVQVLSTSVIIHNYSNSESASLSFEEYDNLPSLEWIEEFIYYFEKYGSWDAVCDTSNPREEGDLYYLGYFTLFKPSEIGGSNVYILTEDSLVLKEEGQEINDEDYHAIEVSVNNSLAHILVDVNLA